MSYVLGIDGGGSKTVCVLMDNSRQLLGRGEAGPSNYQSIGIEAEMLNPNTKLYIFSYTNSKKPKIVNMTSSPQT
ncbi:MAG: BadF/BadG/BcrA/BcrD ATPase family protein, partial [Nostoc sp.]|uniref:BadF/BadG/BcrA/BcrD ATPase family protein n=1 Tax=Nostoc sp. TaxID=1180 RepID=UPI002FEFC098